MMEKDIVGSLRDLDRVRAPERLLPNVLRELGLGYWYAVQESVLGRLLVAYGPRGVVAVRRADDVPEFERWFRRAFDREVRPAERPPERIAAQLAAALRGDRSRLSVDLGALTEFERAVLFKAREIPRGEVRTYGWVAKEIGRPRAVRAVGSALAHNPVPLIVPCHRVVRSDWRLGEYSCGGPEAKRSVLAAEGVEVGELEALARRGVRFQGSETTRIFCLPTCRQARRIRPQHRVPFRSEAEAYAAGYRPCRTCRPALAAA
jgi:O-6-methylguanine DNA methyltransferase